MTLIITSGFEIKPSHHFWKRKPSIIFYRRTQRIEMGLIRRVALNAVCALLACVTYTETHAQTHNDPFHAADLNIAPDLNLDVTYVMSSPNQCGAFRLRRNGMIYSHQQLYEARRNLGMSLQEMNTTARFNYPDDINCTFSVCVGTGKFDENMRICGLIEPETL